MGNHHARAQADRLKRADTLIENRKNLITHARRNIRVHTETVRRGAALLSAIKRKEEYAGLEQAIDATANWLTAVVEYNNEFDHHDLQEAEDAMVDARAALTQEQQVIFESEIIPLQQQYFRAMVNRRYNVEQLERFERELQEINDEVNTERIQIALSQGLVDDKPGESIINQMITDPLMREEILKKYLKSPAGEAWRARGNRRKTRRKRKKRKRVKKRRKSRKH